jgi:hypothetical protein
MTMYVKGSSSSSSNEVQFTLLNKPTDAEKLITAFDRRQQSYKKKHQLLTFSLSSAVDLFWSYF